MLILVDYTSVYEGRIRSYTSRVLMLIRVGYGIGGGMQCATDGFWVLDNNNDCLLPHNLPNHIYRSHYARCTLRIQRSYQAPHSHFP